MVKFAEFIDVMTGCAVQVNPEYVVMIEFYQNKLIDVEYGSKIILTNKYAINVRESPTQTRAKLTEE